MLAVTSFSRDFDASLVAVVTLFRELHTGAISLALRATFSPGRSNKLIELFTHHRFDHDPNGTLRETTQVLVEDLLLR